MKKSDRRALVTGASGGIGYSLSKQLSEEGYRITAVARNEGHLKKLMAELGGSGHDYLVADLATQKGQTLTEERIGSDHYDLLVNNAGVGVFGDFAKTDLEKQISMMRLNCEALVRLSYAYLKNARKGDALINVSSTVAFLPMPTMGLYSATKAFVTSFSEVLWFEQKSRGVYVMALHPGITSTEFRVNAGGRKEDVPQALAQTPEEVAKVAIRELRARKSPTVISGKKNAFASAVFKLIPRKSTVSIMGAVVPKDSN